MGDALLFATAPGEDGGPAAAVAAGGTTVLGRLLGQLESLGVRRAWLVTRPEWTATVAAAVGESAADVTVVATGDLGEDLRRTAEIVDAGSGPLVVANAHVLAHREALAGLLGDPRIASGALTAGSSPEAPFAFPVRCTPARVMSAGSPYHRVEGATGYFLGVLKVDPEDRDRLLAASRELRRLASDPRPAGWGKELERKLGDWRGRLSTEELALRRNVAAADAPALLLVGLVRSDVEVFPRDLDGFFYSTPLSGPAAASAVAEMSRHDEDRALLESAVKTDDSPFTTYLVSPYSKYLARFAARRGWSPNALTLLSLAVGVAAAGAFALGTRGGLIAGAVLLQASFTVDCVDGQLARYTRTFSNLGGWLDSVCDRTKEYLVYGGLALGAARGFGDDVWILAAAALALQTVRHLADVAYWESQRPAPESRPAAPLERPVDSPSVTEPEARERAVGAGRPRWLEWGNYLLRLPIGERLALISLTAAVASPRVTFVALLAWGGVGAVYALGARVVLSYAGGARIVGVVLK